MQKLSHFNNSGDAHMVDVGNKPDTLRRAVASGLISMKPETLEMIRLGKHSKGDVLGVARIAGIMAAKRTAEMIPLCHPLALSHVRIDLSPQADKSQVQCRAQVETTGKTGVEMEALMAVQISLLTIYDMCKAVDRGMTIDQVRLIRKSGGKTGDWAVDGDESQGETSE